MSTKLKVAVAGLGRMGLRHARHFHDLTPKAELVAVSSPDMNETEVARREFEGTQVYNNYDEMLKQEGIQAVVVASVTTVHAAQAIKAIEMGLHVLCEKPLSTSVEISQSVIDAYHKSLKKYPNQKVMCGFSRRFDASYRDAYRRVTEGQIGRPYSFESQTMDKFDPSGFFVGYAEFSGGIFVDCSIHDIDLALWFFGEDSKVKSVSADGVIGTSPGLRKFNDRDTGFGTIEFYGDKIASLKCSRNMAAGQEDTTIVYGTKGKVAVNTEPALNHVRMYEATGIRREIPANYYERFRDAFVTESNEFTACCLNNTDPPVKLEGAVNAVRIGCALQESMISGKKIYFDESGNRLDKAKL